jgi:hypothetical protein
VIRRQLDIKTQYMKAMRDIYADIDKLNKSIDSSGGLMALMALSVEDVKSTVRLKI